MHDINKMTRKQTHHRSQSFCAQHPEAMPSGWNFFHLLAYAILSQKLVQGDWKRWLFA